VEGRLGLQQGDRLRKNCGATIRCEAKRALRWSCVDTFGYSDGRVAERDFWSDISINKRTSFGERVVNQQLDVQRVEWLRVYCGTEVGSAAGRVAERKL